MTKADRNFLLALFLLCGACLQCFVLPGLYWRDSGEFIVAAFYLDIPHPAGFPLYSQLANFFTLLPLGPIGWRVNSFSAWAAAASAAALAYLVLSVCRRRVLAGEALSKTLACCCVVLFSGLEAFLRQAATAEVYALHCLVILVLIVLYERFLYTGDRRFLMALAFVGGLGLGNHAALGLVLLPAAVLIGCTDWSAVRAVLVPALLFGCLGLSVYFYIPLRAQSVLPLNTGEAVSFKRFVSHVTDARDRQARADSPLQADRSLAKGELVSAEQLSRYFALDARAFASRYPAFGALAGIVGLFLLFSLERRLGAAIFVAAGSTWYFFMGWDADPWLPIMALVTLGWAMLIASLLNKVSSRISRGLVLGAFLLILFSGSKGIPVWLHAQTRDFVIPAETAAEELRALPEGATLVDEPSWFLHAYAKYIEGVRPDVNLVYQPSIYLPDYFARLRLSDHSGSTFDSWQDADASEDVMARMGRFTTFAAGRGPFYFEPNQATNQFFSAVARWEREPLPHLQKGSAGTVEAGLAERLSREFSGLHEVFERQWAGFYADSQHYLEGRLTTAADLLGKGGAKAEAARLLQTYCAIPKKCGVVAINNLATLLIESGEPLSAATLLAELNASSQQRNPVVLHNLMLALKQLDESQAQELVRRSGDVSLLERWKAVHR